MGVARMVQDIASLRCSPSIVLSGASCVVGERESAAPVSEAVDKRLDLLDHSLGTKTDEIHSRSS